MLNSQRKSINYEKLVLSCAKSQRSALQALYKSEADNMKALAYKSLAHPQRSDQTVIKTFLTIWESAGSYNPEMGSALGWMYSILRHHINEVYQKNYHELALSHASERGFTAENMSQIVAELGKDPQIVQNCIVFEELPQEQQDSIINMYFSPDNQAVVATRLQLPLARFTENIQIGLNHIAKQLSIFRKHNDTVLIGEYALGGLNTTDNERVIKLLQKDGDAMANLLEWESFFTKFINQLPATAAKPKIWEDLNDRIKFQQDQELRAALNKPGLSDDEPLDLENYSAQPGDIKRERVSLFLRIKYYIKNVHFWQFVAGLCVLLMIGAWLYSGSSHTTDKWIAVLGPNDAKQNPSWVLKVMSNDELQLSPLFHLNGIKNSSFNLWTKSSNGQWKNLGKLDPNQVNVIEPEKSGAINANQPFYITVEPNGSSADKPSGSTLYSGKVVPINP